MLVELRVLRLPLPADQVVGQVAVRKGWRRPLNHQLCWRVGICTGVFGHRRGCERAKVQVQLKCVLLFTDSFRKNQQTDDQLTWWTCADVDDVTLCPGDKFVLHLQGNGLHENSILSPGFEVLKADFWVNAYVLRKIHVHHVPAVWATAVLAAKLCDVLQRAVENMTENMTLPFCMKVKHNQGHTWRCFILRAFANGLAYFRPLFTNVVYFIILDWLPACEASHLFHFVPAQ